jgi:hypothetical protein
MQMLSSIVVVALVSNLLPGVVADEEIHWHTNYQQARAACVSGKKPMAVVAGMGLGGYKKLVREGKLGEESTKQLRDNYICCYIDIETPEGKSLAAEFHLNNGGIVLSDKTGDLQAFYHQGTMADGDLVACLRKCADPNRTVQMTETLGSPRTSMYPPMDGSSPTGYYGTQPGRYAPQFSPYGYAPSYGSGGSCPNCRR